MWIPLALLAPRTKIFRRGNYLRSWRHRSISLTSLLIIVLMITMSCWNLFTYYKDVRGKTQGTMEFQQKMISVSMDHAEKLLASDQFDAALTLIEANYASNYYDFFVMRKNDKPLTESSNVREMDFTAIPVGAENFEIKTPDRTLYLYRKVIGPYDLVMGYTPADTSKLSTEEIIRIFTHNVQDTVLLFLAITGFVLREYFRQVKLIKHGKREEIEKMNPLTKEGRLIKDLFIHASNLTRQKIELEVPDGVEIELSRGTKDRSVFRGGVLRIDLNQYSTLCKERGQAAVDTMLSPVFSDFREVAQRYGFYEIADEGDERVFYIRSENLQEATHLGLSVIRGMFELGRAHAKTLQEQQGVDFKFKASYAYDDLLFVKEDGKYKLKGNAHIISKRCIGTFKERTEKEYVIALPQKDFIGSEFLCEKYSAEKFDLQGVGSLDIVFISRLQNKPDSLEHTKFYCSNDEISQHLSDLNKNWDEKKFWAIYKTLTPLKIIMKRSEHTESVLSLLKDAQKRGASPEVVASLIMMLPKVTSPTELSESVISALKEAMKSPTARIRANALEALGELKAAAEDARNMLSAEDNRTKANALLILGKNEMNSDVEKNLRKFLKSNDDNEVLSGLFVIDKLFAYHSRRDLTFFRTSSFFKDLFADVIRLKHGPSERVRSKAQIVAEIHGELLIPG